MTIEFLQSASKVCFGIAIASAVFAAALFFLLDIWENFLIETDRAQRKTIDEMHERNRATGKLRADDAKKGNTGKVSTKSVTGNGKTLKSADRGKQLSDEVLLIDERQNGQIEKSGLELKANTAAGRGETISLANQNLSQGGYQNGGNVTFKIVQRTIVTHTDEMIPI